MLERVYLIRHGQTAWSLSGRHTGRTDVSLTEQGEQEARALGERLRTLRFDRVFTSPRQRARRTCELAGLASTAEVEEDLQEWDYGDCEGKLSAEIRVGRPDWNIYRDGTPHGESPDQISARADRVIQRFRALEGNIAVFSHGHFGRVLGARWLDLPVAHAQHFYLGTASLSILGHNQGTPPGPAIILWNSRSLEASG